MSETLDPIAAAAPIPDAATETPAPETQTEQPAPETPEQPEETPEQVAQKQESESAKKRFASMTRKLADERRAREQDAKRIAALEALVNAGKEPDPAKQQQTDVETRAAQLIREREAGAQRKALIDAGAKQFGADDWTQKTEVLAAEGALQNAAFMDALLDMPSDEAAKMVAHFADDTDALGGLLGLSAAAIGRRMGQMASEISKPPPGKTVSAAPRPVQPVGKAAVVKEPTVHDANISMKEFVALRQKQAPRSLGGRG